MIEGTKYHQLLDYFTSAKTANVRSECRENGKMTKSDPIGIEFYKPLRTAEAWSDRLFWVAGIFSIAALLVDKQPHPNIYDVVQAIFVVSVVGAFGLGLVARLYWSSRAQLKRNADFVSNAFDVALITETSTGYFNNNQTDPLRRMSFSLLENTFFSKNILQKMLLLERAKLAVYTTAWFLALLYRATDLALISSAAQVLFSEQLLSRWARMEWLRSRVERVYDDAYALIQSRNSSSSREFRARTVEYLLRYETGKAQAGISLSTRLFDRLNPALSKQWAKILEKLEQ